MKKEKFSLKDELYNLQKIEMIATSTKTTFSSSSSSSSCSL